MLLAAQVLIYLDVMFYGCTAWDVCLFAGTTLVVCAMTGCNAVVVDRHEPTCRAMLYRMARLDEAPGPSAELNEAAVDVSEEEEVSE